MAKEIDDSKYLDPVFLKYGMKVYKYEYIQKLRKENLQLKRDGKKSYNLIPQEGFQETVLSVDADIKIVGGKRGGGKANSVDTNVVTPFGMRRLGDLKIGDTITDPCTGGMEKVIAIYEHPDHDIYELQFDDGSSVECGLEHLWKVRQTGYIHKDRHLNGGGVESDYRIWTFGMIKDWLDRQKDGVYQGQTRKGNVKKHLVVPLTEPVKFTCAGNAMKRNDLDPYVLGAIIGDGCITPSAKANGTAQFVSADIEILQEMESAGIDMSNGLWKGNQYECIIHDGRLEEMLTLCKLNGCGSKDKFIPYRYKFATVEERFAIVQGLMDTDGCIDKNGRCSYCTISKTLAEDVKFLIESLGGVAKIRCKEAGYHKEGEYVKCNDAYELHIKFKDTSKLFRLPRKKANAVEYNGGISEVTRRIVGYRYVGKKDARCITVDSVNSLYLVGNFVVTHNTWVGLFEALPYIFNADVNMYGFRKYEDDVKRGIWKSSKLVYRGFGESADSTYEWKFLGGRGATMKMEHLQDQSKISDRFRGVEMAYILIEELPEHTRENMDVLFSLLASNRSTSGVRPKCVCTCNPVGKSNKLYQFLSWWIDPETNTIIKERDGKTRYFYRYGENVSEIAWGDTWQEVFNNSLAHNKIQRLCDDTGSKPEDFITSLVFIEGDFQDNEILKASDPKYMNRISARGGESTTNDIVGVWQDIETGTAMLTMDDMEAFFNNTDRRDGTMRASADVALTGDFFVIFAYDGHHICDMEAWRGTMSEDVIPFVENFLKKNGVRKENFTFDSNGLGLWLSSSNAFRSSIGFNNKSTPSDTRLWNNLKSECAEKFAKAVKSMEFSIDGRLLERKFRDSKGHVFTMRERLMEERKVLKRKENTEGGRFEIISKPQMKAEIGHSPDFIEAMFMVMALFDKNRQCIRKGFNYW